MKTLQEVLNLNEFEELARAQLARRSFEYAFGGAGDEVTLRNNVAAFERRQLRPRVLVDVSKVDTNATLLGQSFSLPVAFAPTAAHKLMHPDGELASTRGTARAGALFCASTNSNCSLQEIAEASDAPKWFQLYVQRDRELSEGFVRAAGESGYEAIVLTADLPVLGRRERDLRVHSFFAHGSEYGNFIDAVAEQGDLDSLTRVHHDTSLTWDFVKRLKDISDLPVVIKGVLTAEDAEVAIEHGVAGIVVSNHGGRQLDRSPASIEVLEEVVAASAGRAEVYLDGGVRRGTDVLIALGLGARAVFVGRPLLFALAAGGEDGVARAFELMQSELETDMALLGAPSLADVTRERVR